MTVGKIFRLDEICEVEYGTRVVQKRDGGSIFPVYGGGGATFQMDKFNREDRLVIARFGMSEECARFVRGKFFLNDSGLTVSPKNGKLLSSFLDYQLYSKQDVIYALGKGSAQKNLDVPAFRLLSFFVPDDLKSQRRIVAILDEAFDGIATAKANAEKNLQNARALFESYLQSVFLKAGAGWKRQPLTELCEAGRVITYGVIKLGDEIPNGIPCLRTSNVRWLRIDVRGLKRIARTLSNEYSRTILKGGEVLVNVRGTLGGVAVVPKEMIGWNVSREVAVVPVDANRINPKFLSYLIGSGASQEWLGNVKKGAAYVGINIEDLRLLPVSAPDLKRQEVIVKELAAMQADVDRLQSIYQRKLAALGELKQSLLHQAFSGELAEKTVQSVVVPFRPKMTATDLHAGILALAYELHEKRGRQNSFGHVKAEKIAHIIEARLDVDLGRNPFKDAAGPNDFRHLMAVEHRAEKAGYFTFTGSKMKGYRFSKGRGFDALVLKTREALGGKSEDLNRLCGLMAGMNTQQAEIFATTYAAWNNLLLDQQPVTDERIVFEARDNWHPDKLKIPEDSFFKAIAWMRDHDLVPTGQGKRVVERQRKQKVNKKTSKNNWLQ